MFLLAILIPVCDLPSPTFHMMYSAYKLSKQGDNIQLFHGLFPILNVSFSMTGSNYCFLARIQVSQETGKVVRYSQFSKNFPQFVVIHRVKSFHIVNETEVDVFLGLPCFLHDPINVGNLISGSSAFSKSACTSGSSRFTYC